MKRAPADRPVDRHRHRRRARAARRFAPAVHLGFVSTVSVVTAAVVLAVGVAPRAARAQTAAAPLPEDRVTLGLDPTMSLDPSAPQVGGIPGGIVPASFSQRSTDEGDWRFDYHGILVAPLNVSFGTRPMPLPGQSSSTWHSPPVVPDDLETFSHTGVVPTTYAQLNFSEGNSIVQGNVSIVARQANASTSFIEPVSQQGITDLFVSFLPPIDDPRLRVSILVGAFSSRYGAGGEYDEGRYGTPLIARVRGVGEQVSAKAVLGSFTLLAEEGFMGQGNQAGSSVIPDLWNDYADPGTGATFVAHGHLGVGYKTWGTLAGHYIRAFSRDDRAGALAPDGLLEISAADLRLTLGRFGHLYLAYARAVGDNARTVSRIISVLNTRGGPGLMDNYLGDRAYGNGTLTTVGGQYDLSLGRLVSYPEPFTGDGPDIYLSLFGMQTHVASGDSRFDNVTMRKFGAEGTYSLLSWLAVSARYDNVAPDVDHADTSFAVLSPRVILRSHWLATNQLVLQYSRWFDGSLTTVRTGSPPRPDVTVVPDTSMLSLSATMWW
jgi:hypothetical protein